MPTKTERILGYLPLTFQVAAGRSALRAVAGAFGNELLTAENSLAALMRAHWVDHADKGAPYIEDLAGLASLYGLAPQLDETVAEPPEIDILSIETLADFRKYMAQYVNSLESVEEFREHLKRYVRTFLEGTVTVRGILRVTSEALGLNLDEELDPWWNRASDLRIDTEPRRDDGARVIFGFPAAQASGVPARPARATGLLDLSGGADLRQAWILRVGIDGATPVEMDLKTGAADPARVTLDEIAGKVNDTLGEGAARHDGRFLTLESPTDGPGSRLEVAEGPRDASGPVLGLPPFTIHGRDPQPARVVGTMDLSGGANLASERFLRIALDGAQVREVDCAGVAPAATTLGEICAALNAAFGFELASHDGRFLTLASDTDGAASTLGFEEPAAGNARQRLFGPVGSFHVGRDAEPARFTGAREVSRGVDLSLDSQIQLGIDGGAPVTVDCAGADPSGTRPEEIVLALNTALGAEAVTFDGRFLTVASPTTGAASEIAFRPAPSGDATQEIFGLPPRVYRGSAATPARITGTRELVDRADVRARHLLGLAVDGGEPLLIDLREGMADPGQASLDELAAVINEAAGATVASHDGRQLTLTSPTQGGGSRLAVEPLEQVRRRRFVTRATLADEASRALLGFVSRIARGEASTSAWVVGRPDLSHGVDLREGSYLRIAVDGDTHDVDCAGPRPRATLLEEAVAKINTGFGRQVATHDGRHLVLFSSTSGTESRIAFEPPRLGDALDVLLGGEPGTVRGRAASGVRFVGTVDLAEGVDLPAGAAVKLGIDGAPPVEIALPAGHRGLSEIALAINLALGMDAARHDGVRLSLASPTQGSGSRLTFAAPAGTDATALLFGFAPPRSYRGTDAEPARITGIPDLSGGANLLTARTLRLAVDAGPVRDVNCAAGAANAQTAQLPEIVIAINSALGVDVASHTSGRLILTSPTPGPAGSLKVEHHGLGDARSVLFGDVPEETRGEAAKPAVITGEVDLLQPVDLDRRRFLRVRVDDGRTVEVNVAGALPRQTFLEEVVAALNAAVPGLASATPDDRLQLTSPTQGPESWLEVLPLRYLEVQEYPPVAVEVARALRHGERLQVVNRGAAGTPLEIEIRAPHGTSGPGLASLALGLEVRVNASLSAGETARIRVQDDAAEASAEIVAPDGEVRPAPVLLRSLPGTSAAPATALTLPRGRTEWIFLECSGSRFDQARFDEDHFAGGDCREAGVFDVSRFGQAVFGAIAAPAVDVTLRWKSHRPGAFVVNLPSDLPARFGGRFNEARFGMPPLKATDPPTLAGVVTEPPGDERDLVLLLDQGEAPAFRASPLVRAGRVPRVPLGFEAVKMPFRKPRFLRLGDEHLPARLYLTEDGMEGFLEIRAQEAGVWGNEIAVVARPAGPGRWDVTIHFAGARFENARKTALGAPLPDLAQDLLQPGPIGILQAKAAGVEARVTRDRAELDS